MLSGMTTPFTLTFDCTEPARLARFWCTALGYVPASPPEGFDSWEQWLRRFGGGRGRPGGRSRSSAV